MNLGKCCVCLDEAIGRRQPVDLDLVADAIVLAPWIMGLPSGPAVMPLPMCLKHRMAMLASNGQGLIVAKGGIPGR